MTSSLWGLETPGARSRWISVNIIPRDIFGLSVLAIAIPLSGLPPRLADLLIWPILKSYYPSYRRLGLTKSERGPFQQIERTGRIPLLDVGTVREIRRGRIAIVSDIAAISGRRISFAENEARTFDAVVLATGYSPCVPSGDIGIPADDGTGEELGLYFCGFYVSPTGMLREIGIEARRIARRVREQVSPSAMSNRRHAG
jgi:indole-3-pyruvate monooxygenase